MWGSSQIDFTCLKDEESSEFFLPDTSVLLTNLSNSPQMAIAHAELNRKSAELAFEKADWIPSIRAGVGIGIGNEAEELSPRASLSFSIPLINWKQGATEAARHGVSQAEARRDAIRIRIYNDVLNTYRNAARLQKEILKFKNTILPQFKEILDASSTAYISGKTGILSLIDAQRNYIEVSREIVEINHEYRHSLIDLERYRITN
jgi:cobalt-zinc-cadmium efflux system outer membrane protein